MPEDYQKILQDMHDRKLSQVDMLEELQENHGYIIWYVILMVSGRVRVIDDALPFLAGRPLVVKSRHSRSPPPV